MIEDKLKEWIDRQSPHIESSANANSWVQCDAQRVLDLIKYVRQLEKDFKKADAGREIWQDTAIARAELLANDRKVILEANKRIAKLEKLLKRVEPSADTRGLYREITEVLYVPPITKHSTDTGGE